MALVKQNKSKQFRKWQNWQLPVTNTSALSKIVREASGYPVKRKIIQLLGKNLWDLGLGGESTDMTPKEEFIQEKKLLNVVRENLKLFLLYKRPGLQGWKDKPQMGKKNFCQPSIRQGLLSRICKELSKLNNKKKTQYKMDKRHETFHRRRSWLRKNHIKRCSTSLSIGKYKFKSQDTSLPYQNGWNK